jgi:membrane protease YdiL (CAAX protease family)
LPKFRKVFRTEIEAPMKKYPLIFFYLIAIGIAWLGWAPLVLGSQGVSAFQSPFFQVLLILPATSPMLAAVIVTRQLEGRQAARSLPGRLFHWRVNIVWVLVALAIPVGLLFLGKWVTGWLGLSGKQMLPQGDQIATFISAFIMALVTNPWEEVGWRGFALPRLQLRYNALVASLAVGVMWTFWHLPPCNANPIPVIH